MSRTFHTERRGRTMAVAIRQSRADERVVVAEIHRSSATLAYSGIFPPGDDFPWDETLARWLNFAGEIRVAEADEPAARTRLVGFVAFDVREIHALYVLPEYWNRGPGGQLLEAAGGACECWVLRDNARARRFYEKKGWEASGNERQTHNVNGVTELRYIRRG